MLIRTRLLLLGLATLGLPWAGCQYAREMESSLREAERQSLLAVAQTVATSLRGRGDLLYRGESGERSREPPGPYDLQPVPLDAEPQIDGAFDDWPVAPRATRRFAGAERDELTVLAGTFGRFLYLQLDVRDAGLVTDASDGAALEPSLLGDRIWLGFTDANGRSDQIFLSSASTGTLRGRRIVAREFGRPETVEERRVDGAWVAAPRAGGWRAEIRLPLSMVGGRIGVLIDDRDRRGAAPVGFGSLDSNDLAPRGRLIAASPELRSYLEQFRQPGVRLIGATPSGGVLAEVDALPVPSELAGAQAILSRLYRRVLERSDLAERVAEVERGRLDELQAAEAARGRSTTALLSTTDQRRLVVAAAAPILDAGGERVIGVLQVAQTVDRWLLLRDRALTRLLNLTLIVTVFALLAVGLFGAWLARRLGRLQRASESGLNRDGRLQHAEFPDIAARDELGEVSRSFSRLLARLDEYTGYLRSLAGKLAHEIRTPLTIVRSSLENLASEPLTPEAKLYADRAREGSERLAAILTAMGAATRVEEAIAQAERVRFDLLPVVRGAVEAYRSTFPQREFVLEADESRQVTLSGAPDLIVQALDKLVDNALDFATPGSPITVRIVPAIPPNFGGDGLARLEVENRGPRLPPEASERLFESLWQSRTDRDSRPHFGLGLYIVKLIAEFHGGRAAAQSLDDPAGARFELRLPETVTS